MTVLFNVENLTRKIYKVTGSERSASQILTKKYPKQAMRLAPQASRIG